MMVTLNAGGSGEAAPSPSGSGFGASARSMVAKGTHPLHRRRRVGKGTISGFGYNNKSTGGNVVDPSGGTQSASSSPSDPSKGETSCSDMSATNLPKPTPPTGPGSTSSGTPLGANQPQHSKESSAPPAKPCHSARMSVLCCQNSIRMGARVQLGLCPPGRPRRTLQAALRQRTRASSSSTNSSSHQTTTLSPQASAISRRLAVSTTSNDPTGYYSLESMIGTQSLEDYEDQEEDYLLSTNTFDVESDEEASSGDEDELSAIDALLAPEAPSSSTDESKYLNLREPMFTPLGVDGSISNPNGAPMVSGMGSSASGKLPFNRRKIRYFDGITAQDRQVARAYLIAEADKARRRSALLLTRHLKRMQKEERKKRRRQKGEMVEDDPSNESENEDPKEKELLAGGVAQFEQPMTAAVSAALILESLSLNPVESIEGMAKCYDGIVAAGVALMDSQRSDPTSSHETDTEKKKPRTNRTDVLAALAPLLITSLEQPAGDVILLLARMRRMCGTPRYQRRFVQRVAPRLIRPKNAAMWCLRHQNDMEPIVAAAELIFDAAHEIFSKGWYEKGQLYLADSKRAATLNSAAAQLRTMSGEPATEGLSLGLTMNHVHGLRRHNTGTAQKDQKNSSDHLAEWEVMAVDKEIRLSISKIMSSDWNRVILNPVKDSDSARSFRRTTTSNKRPSVLPQSASGEASPRAMITSPRSPGRPLGAKTPLSPLPCKDYNSSPAPSDTMFENIMPPHPIAVADRPTSPDNSFVQKSGMATVTSPPANRYGNDDLESKNAPISSSTPPRSPKSPMREGGVEQAPPLSKTSSTPQTPFTPISPRRSKALSPPSSQNISSAPEGSPAPFAPSLGTAASASASAPLSPSSIGSSTADFVSYRPSSGSSVISTGSGASQTAHYRTLTSTASERKRTVAACRALRAQITRFEDAFIQQYGRPPKGASERQPLATTYSQYREWKRAIRADAACRIQALFRGARCRWILMRSENPRINHIVRSRAGRTDYVSQTQAPEQAPRPLSNQENLLNHIGIPVEIGELDPNRPAGLKPSSVSLGSSIASAPVGDPFAVQPVNLSLAPQNIYNQVVLRRAGTGDRAPEGFPAAAIAPRTIPSPMPAAPPNASPDATSLSLQELQAKKRELKQQLKQYDMNFARKHGRMPVKAEKEPIRHLYENYNSLKSQISLLEHEGGRQMQGPPGVQQLTVTSSAAAPPSIRMMAPPPTPTDSSDSDRSIDSSGLMGSAGRAKRKNTKSPPMAASSTPAGAPSQDLADLKAEKGRLHQMLRSYEKDFFREHQRQVSSFADIKPVASQYRRYKEIKKAISSLQGSSER